MLNTITAADFTKAMDNLLEETFTDVQNYYLDRGTSLFETLAGITAEQASVPAGGKCASLAAQVKHVSFYLDFVVNSVQDPNYPEVDWGEIWRTVSSVTEDQWLAIQAELRASYKRIRDLVNATPAWGEAEITGALAVVAHSAYHLGEIRQALCIIKS